MQLLQPYAYCEVASTVCNLHSCFSSLQNFQLLQQSTNCVAAYCMQIFQLVQQFATRTAASAVCKFIWLLIWHVNSFSFLFRMRFVMLLQQYVNSRCFSNMQVLWLLQLCANLLVASTVCNLCSCLLYAKFSDTLEVCNLRSCLLYANFVVTLAVCNLCSCLLCNFCSYLVGLQLMQLFEIYANFTVV